jgi:hypothetical protein
MRVMVIVKSSMESEAGKMPSPQLLADMGKFNQELMKGGIFLDAGGLQPSSKGKGIRFSGSRRTVLDGLSPRPRNDQGTCRRFLNLAGSLHGTSCRVGQTLPQCP